MEQDYQDGVDEHHLAIMYDSLRRIVLAERI